MIQIFVMWTSELGPNIPSSALSLSGLGLDKLVSRTLIGAQSKPSYTYIQL